MTLTTVVNLKRELYDVYIGRGSMWGNPFKMESEADRERVIREYKKYLKKAILSGEISALDLKHLKVNGWVLLQAEGVSWRHFSRDC